MYWNSLSPPYMRLRGDDYEKAVQLEELRRQLEIPHELFVRWVLGSRWATERAIRSGWDRTIADPEMRGMSDGERLRWVYEQRKQIAAVVDAVEYPALPSDCDTPEKFVEFVMRFESQFGGPDPFRVADRVDLILSGVRAAMPSEREWELGPLYHDVLWFFGVRPEIEGSEVVLQSQQYARAHPFKALICGMPRIPIRNGFVIEQDVIRALLGMGMTWS